MAEYSEKDRQAFQRKDRQQALGYAVEQAIKILDSRLDVNEVLAVADKVANYTAAELLSLKTEPQKKPAGRPPKKSAAISEKAQKVLDALVAEYSKTVEVDIEKLKAEVLKIRGRYPTNLKSVPIVLKSVKPESVMKK